MKSFRFNPKKDRKAVDVAACGVDLREAYVHGTVPSNVSGGEVSYNDCEDPGSLMSHPRDTFEAYRQSDYVKGGLKKPADSESSAASSTD